MEIVGHRNALTEEELNGAASVLVKASILIADPAKWTNSPMQRDRCTGPWCIKDALEITANRRMQWEGTAVDLAFAFVVSALAQASGDADSIPSVCAFNDHPGRVHEEVMQVMQAALMLCLREQLTLLASAKRQRDLIHTAGAGMGLMAVGLAFAAAIYWGLP